MIELMIVVAILGLLLFDALKIDQLFLGNPGASDAADAIAESIKERCPLPIGQLPLENGERDRGDR